MVTHAQQRLEQRVIAAAEEALSRQEYVSAIDVLVGVGWLHPTHVKDWRSGRVPYLERIVQANLAKISGAMKLFQHWAQDRGLTPSETVYVARTRDRRQLQFSKSGQADIEQAYRTHWVSPTLSERKRERLAERASKPPDLVVIAPVRDFTCDACGGSGSFLMMEEAGALCLACTDMDHLVFLPSGNAALTRRAKAASDLSAVVVRWSRSRKRYERQGILVEEEALAEAEAATLADADARAQRRERDEARRAAADSVLQQRMAAAIRELYPSCPPERAEAIAAHAAARGSGRVGRTAAAKELDPEMLRLAVVASVRHADTSYDRLLMAGAAREDARRQVRGEVDAVLESWSAPS